jgi:serralysin
LKGRPARLTQHRKPLSYDESDVAVVRVTDVQADRFTVYVDEDPDQDGSHAGETVSWLVLE